METIQDKINKDNIKDIAEITIQKMRTIMEETFPMMEDTSVEVVAEAIKDSKFRILQPWSDETEQLLEEITPIEEVPQATDVIRDIEALDPLIENDKTLLGELFNALEVAHEQLAMACSPLCRLSRILKSQQLSLVLKAGVHPVIQMNMVEGLLEPQTTRRQLILPDNQSEWVKLLMTPDLMASYETRKIGTMYHNFIVQY